MPWTDSFIHANNTDFLYVKPRPITASLGWSSGSVLGVQNLAFGRRKK